MSCFRHVKPERNSGADSGQTGCLLAGLDVPQYLSVTS